MGGEHAGGSVHQGEQRPAHLPPHLPLTPRLRPTPCSGGGGAAGGAGRPKADCAPPRPRPRNPERGECTAFPSTVAKVTMTLPRPQGSECSGGGGRCWETPSRQAARGRLRAADSGRQYALSWPALAPSLPPQYQKDAGFRSSPKSRLRPGQMCRPGASSFSVTLCHCLCPEFVHQFTSFCLRPPSIPPFADHYYSLPGGLPSFAPSFLTVCHPLGSQSSYQELTRQSHSCTRPSTGFPAQSNSDLTLFSSLGD